MTGVLDITEGSVRRRKVLSYDFRQGTVLTKQQVKALIDLHQPIVESIGLAVGGLMRASFKATLDDIEMLPARMLEGRKDLCALSFGIEPAGLTGVLTLSLRAAHAIADRLMGGRGDVPKHERPLTKLETRFVGKALSWGVLAELCKGWPADRTLTLRPKELFVDPAASKFAPSWEIVGRVQFTLSGLVEDVGVSLWFPLSLMEELAGAAGGEVQKVKERVERKLDLGRWDRVEQLANDVPVPAVVILGGTELSVREVLRLAVGDVVRLDNHTSDALTVIVQGKPKLLGRPGLRNGRLAVQICDVIEKGQK